MKSLKVLLPIVLVSSFLYAIEDNNTTQDSFEPASNSSKNPREGYMPELITPDNLKSGIYGGLALSGGIVNFSGVGFSTDTTSLDLSLITGYNINSYLATEGRATISIANDNSIDYKKFSLFLKPKYEVTNGLNLYSLVGLGKVSAKSINSNKTDSSKTSLQLGVGADYKLDNNFKIFADYVYLGKDKSAKYNDKPASLKSASITTGISYDF